MKIYENEQEYNEVLKYWSNACGDLHEHGKRDITVDELPDILKDAYERFWSDSYGVLCYLAEYKGKYGIALIAEYHEYTQEGDPNEPNNFAQAVNVATALEEADFPSCEVFIGKEMGFPGCCKADPYEKDLATELVLFIETEGMPDEVFMGIVKQFEQIAYI